MRRLLLVSNIPFHEKFANDIFPTPRSFTDLKRSRAHSIKVEPYTEPYPYIFSTLKRILLNDDILLFICNNSDSDIYFVLRIAIHCQ